MANRPANENAPTENNALVRRLHVEIIREVGPNAFKDVFRQRADGVDIFEVQRWTEVVQTHNFLQLLFNGRLEPWSDMRGHANQPMHMTHPVRIFMRANIIEWADF